MPLEGLEPLFKFSIHLSVRKSRENIQTDIWKASLWGNLSTDTPPKFFSKILCFLASVYNFFFFYKKPLCGNYSTLDSHTNTVVSHAFAYSSRWRQKPWQGLLSFEEVEIHKIFITAAIGALGLFWNTTKQLRFWRIFRNILYYL